MFWKSTSHIVLLTMASSELFHDPLLSSVKDRGGYKILGGVALYAKLGQGGMGAVYKGRHVRLDIDVALKVMVPPVGISPEHAKDFVNRFIREARTMAQLDHPNIVRVYDFGHRDDLYYLIMELVDAATLDQRIPDDHAEAVRIFHQVASLVSREARPGNPATPSGRPRAPDSGEPGHR